MRKDNRERKEYYKNYYSKNREILRLKSEEFRKKNRKKLSEQQKKYYFNNQEKRKAYNKKYYNTNAKILKQKTKEYRVKNNKTILKQRKQYRIKNKEELKKRQNKLYQINRNNPRFRLDMSVSSAIYQCLKSKKAERQWESLVDFNLNDLVIHLEKQFDDKMTWENYGKYWHLDHKVPKTWFKYINPEDKEFKKCWSLSNLQPLFWQDNVKKGNRFKS